LDRGRGNGLWNKERPRTDLIVVNLEGSGLGLFKGEPLMDVCSVGNASEGEEGELGKETGLGILVASSTVENHSAETVIPEKRLMVFRPKAAVLDRAVQTLGTLVNSKDGIWGGMADVVERHPELL
jgi:hypothetical protein